MLANERTTHELLLEARRGRSTERIWILQISSLAAYLIFVWKALPDELNLLSPVDYTLYFAIAIFGACFLAFAILQCCLALSLEYRAIKAIYGVISGKGVVLKGGDDAQTSWHENLVGYFNLLVMVIPVLALTCIAMPLCAFLMPKAWTDYFAAGVGKSEIELKLVGENIVSSLTIADDLFEGLRTTNVIPLQLLIHSVESLCDYWSSVVSSVWGFVMKLIYIGLKIDPVVVPDEPYVLQLNSRLWNGLVKSPFECHPAFALSVSGCFIVGILGHAVLFQSRFGFRRNLKRVKLHVAILPIFFALICGITSVLTSPLIVAAGYKIAASADIVAYPETQEALQLRLLGRARGYKEAAEMSPTFASAELANILQKSSCILGTLLGVATVLLGAEEESTSPKATPPQEEPPSEVSETEGVSEDYDDDDDRLPEEVPDHYHGEEASDENSEVTVRN